MVLQVPQVRETFSTFVAHKLFLPGVYLLVGFQAVALVEAASAGVAGERLLPGVDALVSVQVAHVAEAFPACVAAERLLSSVDHLWGDNSFSCVRHPRVKPNTASDHFCVFILQQIHQLLISQVCQRFRSSNDCIFQPILN